MRPPDPEQSPQTTTTTPFCLVVNTCPDQKTAIKVANALVHEKLAACVNILPGITSVYPWKGSIETSEEVLLLIKTRNDRYAALETRLRELHPYELPELITVSLSGGLNAYLGWITDSVTY